MPSEPITTGNVRSPKSKRAAEWLNARNVCFLGLMAAAAAIFFRPLALVIAASVSVDQYSQILVVPPISLALIYLEQRRIFAKVGYSKLGGMVYVAFSLLFVGIAFFARGLDSSTYISLALLLFSGCVAAAFLCSYGQTAFRSALFPLCFLVFMTPMPDALRERTITFLQYGSAVVTDWFFNAANIPFSRDGVIIVLPSVTIEIAQECSGIRSSVILVIAGLVLGHLFLTRVWSKAALLLFLVPLTIAKNALRIFTLSTLGMYVNPSFLSGRLHHQGGIVFFAASFVALWFIVWLLQKFEGKQVAAKAVPQT